MMVTKTAKRIKQVAIALLAMLSLSVASVAACACSHHAPPSEPKASCHGPAHHGETKKADGRGPAFDQSCACFVASNERSVKAESFKLKKLDSGLIAAAIPERLLLVSSTPDFIPTPGVLSYDRLKSSGHLSRGPPRS